MSTRVLKWLIPVDDNDHPIGSGPVALVQVQHAAVWASEDRLNGRQRLSTGTTPVVTVWTIELETVRPLLRSARVYGTGQPVLEGDKHLGSCIDGPLVWHVFASTRTPAPLREVSSS